MFDFLQSLQTEMDDMRRKKAIGGWSEFCFKEALKIIFPLGFVLNLCNDVKGCDLKGL